MKSNRKEEDESTTRCLFHEQCEKGAKALAEADILLLVTGAGFSADSGLAVYGDVAKVPAYSSRGLDYSDICQPQWLWREPELFYGFWGQCFNDYRITKPHKGYKIIAKWRNEKNSKKSCEGESESEILQDIKNRIKHKIKVRRSFDDEETKQNTPYVVEDYGEVAGAFFTFTSNVDAHSYDFFEAYEIHDCHGNVELWQCSDRHCESGIWRAPIKKDFNFKVDPTTMLATEYLPPEDIIDSQVVAADAVGDASTAKEEEEEDNNNNDDSKPARVGQTKGSGNRTDALQYLPHGTDEIGWLVEEGKNWPQCGHCGSLARPAILMFGDFNWKYDMSQDIRWDLWREAIVETSSSSLQAKICVLEIGCGLNVPTCRYTSEDLLESVLQRGGNATLVRINPDFPMASQHRCKSIENETISIKSKGLEALELIDKLYMSYKKEDTLTT